MNFALTWKPLFGQHLPDQIQIEIINFLSSIDLNTCFAVSKAFYHSLKVIALLTNVNIGIMDTHINYGK